MKDIEIQVNREERRGPGDLQEKGTRKTCGLRFQNGGPELYQEEEYPVIEPY